MKKSKIVTSVLLATLMAGSSMTAMAGSVDYAPSGSNPILSGTEANGSTTGSGTIMTTRSDELFLVALPHNADPIRFYVDPTSKVYSTRNVTDFDGVAFENSKQEYVFDSSTKPNHIFGETGEVEPITAKGLSNHSDFIMAYNAGSQDVKIDLTVSARVIRGKTQLPEDEVDKHFILGVEASENNVAYDDNGFNAIVSKTIKDGSATVALQKAKEDYAWKYVKKSDSYQVATQLTLEEMKAAYGLTASDKEYNTFDPFNYYPMSAFRINASAPNLGDNWWKNDMLLDLNFTWNIKNELSQEPWIETNWTVDNIQEGADVPVFLGEGDSAAKTVTKVTWHWKEVGNSNNKGEYELFEGKDGRYCSFVRKNTTETYLHFNTAGLERLIEDPKYLPANLTVTFDNGSEVNFVLWIK